jgi:hypothetical protein
MSTRGLHRPRQHGLGWNLRRAGNSHKANWIRQLQALGLRYEIEVLEEFATAERLYESEQEWIAAARAAGCDLTNKSDGGPGPLGVKYDADVIERMSAAQKRRYHSPGSIHPRRGRTHTPEARAAIAAGHRGRKLASEHRAKIGDAVRGQKRTEQQRAALSKKRGGRPFKDERGNVYFSAPQAAEALGISNSGIWNVLHGNYRQYRGHTFTFLD